MKLLLARPRLTLAAWLGFWGLLVLLTHVPLTHGPSTRIPHLDKIAHFGLYFGLALLGAVRLVACERILRVRKLVLWGVLYAVYGVMDELTQPWARRTADVEDWLADAFGIAAATWLAILWLRRTRLSEPGEGIATDD
ncbi:MAG: VanZ family protein, partial [Phycisphaerales bacterium]|nr:VanZ family protein [Phycisphaerales bacterium]